MTFPLYIPKLKNKHNSIIFTLKMNRNKYSYSISNLIHMNMYQGILYDIHIFRKSFLKRLHCIDYYFHVLGINFCIILTYSWIVLPERFLIHLSDHFNAKGLGLHRSSLCRVVCLFSAIHEVIILSVCFVHFFYAIFISIVTYKFLQLLLLI